MFDELHQTDWIIAACFSIGALYGWIQGFFVIALTLLCWAAAMLLSINYSSDGGVYLRSVFDEVDYLKFLVADERIARVIAGLGIFIVVSLLGNRILTPILGQLMGSIGFAGLSRLLGAASGFLAAGIVLMLLTDLLEDTFQQKKWWKKSVFIPILQDYKKPVKRRLDKLSLES